MHTKLLVAKDSLSPVNLAFSCEEAFLTRAFVASRSKAELVAKCPTPRVCVDGTSVNAW